MEVPAAERRVAKGCMHAGVVKGEVRLPHSRNRGFQFARGDCAACSTAASTRPPYPTLGRAVNTRAVVLDGFTAPEAVALHHLEAPGLLVPPKETFEGESIMLLPRYR